MVAATVQLKIGSVICIVGYTQYSVGLHLLFKIINLLFGVKCHIKCSIYWFLVVDIQSSLLENIQNPVVYMTDQLTIHCSSTLHNNNELSKGFAFFQEWQPRSDFINHMVQKMKHICHFCDGLFFKSHVWDQTLQQEGPLWHRDNSIIWRLWQESKLVLWGVSEFIAENKCGKRKLNKSKSNNSDLL